MFLQNILMKIKAKWQGFENNTEKDMNEDKGKNDGIENNMDNDKKR